MDKLKAQLAVVSKYSFWIMCGGILIVCLGSWWVATGKLAKEQETQLQAIKTNFDAMSSLRGNNQKHPNTSTAEGMAQLLRSYSVEVSRGWQLQYDQQAAVLVWPASFDDEFRSHVDKLRPIEIVPPPPTPIAMDLPLAERRMYRNFIDQEIPALAETIGAKWLAKPSASGGDGFGSGGSGGEGYGGAGMTPGGAAGFGGPGQGAPGSAMMPADGSNPAAVEDKSIVLWNVTNQQEILNTHFKFITREEPPSTLEVLYAQEDLWILQNIMDIIRAANRDADGKDAAARHEATVKMIDFVRIGRSAMGMAGKVSSIGAAANQGGYGAEMSGGASTMAMPSSTADAGSASSGGTTSMAAPGSPMSAADGMGVAAVNTDPAFGRYVNEKYEPLDPAKLRAALTSRSPADALLAVAKRMPVRMRFTIDQRRLNRLVAECGNSRLPVEVRQVRINREAAPAGGGGGYADGGYGSSGGSGGSMSMPGMGGGMGGMSSGMGGMSSGMDGGSSMSGGYSGGGYSGGGMSGMGGYSGGSMPGMSGMPGAAGGPRRVGGADSTASIDQNLIVVELYGIVYVYNPVNKSQLGLEETITTAATTPATTPATAPPSATPSAVAPATTPATPVSSPPPAGDAPAATGTVPPAAIIPTVGTGP